MSINAHLPIEGTGDGIARSSRAKLRGLLEGAHPPSTDGFGINMGSARGGPCEESELGTCRFTAERDARSHSRPRGIRSLLGRGLGGGMETLRWPTGCSGSSSTCSKKRGRGNRSASHQVSGDNQRDFPRDGVGLRRGRLRERLRRFGAEIVFRRDVRGVGLK
jgi:hypothetical protein